MTIIDQQPAIQAEGAPATPLDVPAPAGRRPRMYGILAAVTTIVVAAGLAVVAVQIAASSDHGTKPSPSSPSDLSVVVGTGPNSVSVGTAPTFGGDPALGETDASYFARTGRHLPNQSATRDEYVRDLVDRGVVPAASLDDGTLIVSGDTTD